MANRHRDNQRAYERDIRALELQTAELRVLTRRVRREIRLLKAQTNKRRERLDAVERERNGAA